uniref:Uncharacterized protein n=1 Tax=Panagrolaimus superbus TaxID=310955 RepID=A0A914YYT2_9BILA
MKILLFLGCFGLFLMPIKSQLDMIDPEMMNLALAYLCYVPEPAYAMAGLVDFNEITNLSTVLQGQLMPVVESGNYASIDPVKLFEQIKAMAPNTYKGILIGIIPFRNRFKHLSTNSKRFFGNTKRRLFGLVDKTEELQNDFSQVSANINSVLKSWYALPKVDRECIASFIPVLKNLILSDEFASTINATGTATSQDDLMVVGLGFYGVLMDHNCTNPF